MLNIHQLESTEDKEQQFLLRECLSALGSLPDMQSRRTAVSLSVEYRNQRADQFTELFDLYAPERGATMETLLEVVRRATDLDEVNFLKLANEVKEEGNNGKDCEVTMTAPKWEKLPASKTCEQKIWDSTPPPPTTTITIEVAPAVAVVDTEDGEKGRCVHSENGTEDGQFESRDTKHRFVETEMDAVTVEDPVEGIEKVKEAIVVQSANADSPLSDFSDEIPNTRDAIPVDLPTNSENPDKRKKKKSKKRSNKSKKKNTVTEGPIGSEESMVEAGPKDEGSSIESAANTKPKEKRTFECSVIPIHTTPKTSVTGALKTLVSFVTGSVNAAESKDKARELEQSSMGSFIKLLWSSEESSEKVAEMNVVPVKKTSMKGKRARAAKKTASKVKIAENMACKERMKEQDRDEKGSETSCASSDDGQREVEDRSVAVGAGTVVDASSEVPVIQSLIKEVSEISAVQENETSIGQEEANRNNISVVAKEDCLSIVNDRATELKVDSSDRQQQDTIITFEQETETHVAREEEQSGASNCLTRIIAESRDVTPTVRVEAAGTFALVDAEEGKGRNWETSETLFEDGKEDGRIYPLVTVEEPAKVEKTKSFEEAKKVDDTNFVVSPTDAENPSTNNRPFELKSEQSKGELNDMPDNIPDTKDEMPVELPPNSEDLNIDKKKKKKSKKRSNKNKKKNTDLKGTIGSEESTGPIDDSTIEPVSSPEPKENQAFEGSVIPNHTTSKTGVGGALRTFVSFVTGSAIVPDFNEKAEQISCNKSLCSSKESLEKVVNPNVVPVKRANKKGKPARKTASKAKKPAEKLARKSKIAEQDCDEEGSEESGTSSDDAQPNVDVRSVVAGAGIVVGGDIAAPLEVPVIRTSIEEICEISALKGIETSIGQDMEIPAVNKDASAIVTRKVLSVVQDIKTEDTGPHEQGKKTSMGEGEEPPQPPIRTAGPFTMPCSRLYPSVISCSCPGHRNVPTIGQNEDRENGLIPSTISSHMNATPLGVSPYSDGMVVFESAENIWQQTIDLSPVAKTIFKNEPIENFVPRRQMCMPELADPAIICTGTISTYSKSPAVSSTDGSTKSDGERRRSKTPNFGIPISIEDLMSSAGPPKYREGPRRNQKDRSPPPGFGPNRFGPHAPKPQTHSNHHGRRRGDGAPQQSGIPRSNPEVAPASSIPHRDGVSRSYPKVVPQTWSNQNVDRRQKNGIGLNFEDLRKFMADRWHESLGRAVPYPGTGAEIVVYREEFDCD